MRNLDTIVTFYQTTDLNTTFERQHRFRPDVDKETPLICFSDMLLPFVIRRLHTNGTSSDLDFWLSYYETSISQPMDNSLLFIVNAGYYDYILFYGDTALDVLEGRFMYCVKDKFPTTDILYYSETLEAFLPSARGLFTEILFCNTTKLNNIPAGFYQKVYIDNVFKCPDFIRKDTGDEVDGLIVYEKRIIQPVMVIKSMDTPEPLLHALVYLPIMDYVRVTENTGDVWFPQEVRFKEPEYPDVLKGGSAKVEMQFIKKTVIKKLTFSETEEETGGTITMGRHFELMNIVIPANTIVECEWEAPFANTSYTYVMTAFDTNGNPVFPMVKEIHTNRILVWAATECTCRIIAGE